MFNGENSDWGFRPGSLSLEVPLSNIAAKSSDFVLQMESGGKGSHDTLIPR